MPTSTADAHPYPDVEHTHDRDCYLPPLGLPYGGEPIEGIPVPPFADIVEYEVFSMWLRQHVALIDDAPTRLPTIALNAALGALAPAHDATDIVLSASELVVAFITCLPVPWTLPSLASALSSAGLPHRIDDRGRWHTAGAEVELTARPFRFEDGWLVTAVEDGQTTKFRVADDVDLMCTWMHNFLRLQRAVHPFPVGGMIPRRELASLLPTAIAARARHGVGSTHPLNVSWAIEHSLCWLLGPDVVESMDEIEIERCRDDLRSQRRAELTSTPPVP